MTDTTWTTTDEITYLSTRTAWCREYDLVLRAAYGAQLDALLDRRKAALQAALDDESGDSTPARIDNLDVELEIADETIIWGNTRLRATHAIMGRVIYVTD